MCSCADPLGVEMHYNINSSDAELPCWRTFRGTSSVESWHSRYHSHFDGFNISEPVFAMQTALAVLDWNRRQDVRLGLRDDCLAPASLLRAINDQYAGLGGTSAMGYRGVDRYVSTAVEEAFQFDWRRLTGQYGRETVLNQLVVSSA